MSKKRRAKASLLPRILVCVGILLAIAAIIFPAMDALMLETVTKNLITGEVLSTSQEPLLTGFQVAFGTEVSNDYFSIQTLEPSGGTIAFTRSVTSKINMFSVEFQKMEFCSTSPKF